MKLPFALLSVPGDIVPMIFMSIALGYLHIMVGLVMQMINKIKLKQHFEMATGGLAWFLSLLGGGMMILPAFAPFFAGDILFWAGAAILGAGAAMTIALPAVKYGRRWYAGIGKGLYSLYGATSYFGDFVSYTRLMALGVAGGSVALAFNTIIVFLPLPARFSVGIVLAVVLHGLNIVLSMLSAYVHGIRLQFIEFFNKFYTGGGKKFEPFKAAEKNVIISDADND
jgi:V/A-type H+-transporting ATPase subunit I